VIAYAIKGQFLASSFNFEAVAAAFTNVLNLSQLGLKRRRGNGLPPFPAGTFPTTITHPVGCADVTVDDAP
jgi:hypothetical protein